MAIPQSHLPLLRLLFPWATCPYHTFGLLAPTSLLGHLPTALSWATCLSSLWATCPHLTMWATCPHLTWVTCPHLTLGHLSPSHTGPLALTSYWATCPHFTLATFPSLLSWSLDFLAKKKKTKNKPHYRLATLNSRQCFSNQSCTLYTT